ncbi:hypothetical protein RchiOBHm_Chr3g0482131 [Rosa chinensis]|uniref:Uncharacterized protein n=1 Tax=Rosa chinensis TaxID=74649 RepID=A0A2P6RE47_ROSCH|nr:hypothetical protein RchiOBHm_Chr3g0482131 [Rosa chinensis]
MALDVGCGIGGPMREITRFSLYASFLQALVRISLFHSLCISTKIVEKLLEVASSLHTFQY